MVVQLFLASGVPLYDVMGVVNLVALVIGGSLIIAAYITLARAEWLTLKQAALWATLVLFTPPVGAIIWLARRRKLEARATLETDSESAAESHEAASR